MVNVENDGTKRLYALMELDGDGWLGRVSTECNKFSIVFCFIFSG